MFTSTNAERVDIGRVSILMAAGEIMLILIEVKSVILQSSTNVIHYSNVVPRYSKMTLYMKNEIDIWRNYCKYCHGDFNVTEI